MPLGEASGLRAPGLSALGLGAPGLRCPGQAPGAAAVHTDSVGWVLTQGHCFLWAELFTSLIVQTQGVFPAAFSPRARLGEEIRGRVVLCFLSHCSHRDKRACLGRTIDLITVVWLLLWGGGRALHSFPCVSTLSGEFSGEGTVTYSK